MTLASKMTLAIIILTAVLYTGSFLLAPPASWTETNESFHWTLANSILYASLHVGAALLFLIGVSAYKAKLKAMYTVIAVGVAMNGVGLAHVVMLNLFGLIQTPWVQYGGVLLPFLAAGLTIYFGTRGMAKLIGVQSRFMNTGLVLVLAAVSVLIVAFLPHGPAESPEVFFDAFNSISTWNMILYAASLGIVLKMKSHMGEHYTKSTAWLSVGLFGSFVITVFVLTATLMSGSGPEGIVLETILTIGGLLYLKAGQSFAQTREL